MKLLKTSIIMGKNEETNENEEDLKKGGGG